MSWKNAILGMTAALTLATGVAASSFGAAPADYESAAEAYISARLEDPHAARFHFTSQPYQVFADIKGYEGLPCWAVDVRVKARLPGGRTGGYVPYTVLFLDGEPIAFEEDAQRLVKA